MKDIIKKILKESDDLEWIDKIQGMPGIRLKRQMENPKNCVNVKLRFMFGDGDKYVNEDLWFFPNGRDRKLGSQFNISVYSMFDIDDYNFTIEILKKYEENRNHHYDDHCSGFDLNSDECERARDLGVIQHEWDWGIDGSLRSVEIYYYDNNGNRHDAELDI